MSVADFEKYRIAGAVDFAETEDGLVKAVVSHGGVSGELVLHPSNVEIVNKAYSPTEEEVAFYQGMIDALDRAQAEGRASCIYDGEHIDIAHAKTAREIIVLAQSFND